MGQEMTPSLKSQFTAARLTGYGAIALRRKGDYVVVEIERDGGVVRSDQGTRERQFLSHC